MPEESSPSSKTRVLACVSIVEIDYAIALKLCAMMDWTVEVTRPLQHSIAQVNTGMLI